VAGSGEESLGALSWPIKTCLFPDGFPVHGAAADEGEENQAKYKRGKAFHEDLLEQSTVDENISGHHIDIASAQHCTHHILDQRGRTRWKREQYRQHREIRRADLANAEKKIIGCA
jgi:hypothetical protein